MTPRQMAIHAHFERRDRSIDEVRMVRCLQLAFGGDKQAFDEWWDTLDLE